MKQSVYLIRVYNPFVLVDDAKLGAFDALCKVISPNWEREIPNCDGIFPLFPPFLPFLPLLNHAFLHNFG